MFEGQAPCDANGATACVCWGWGWVVDACLLTVDLVGRTTEALCDARDAMTLFVLEGIAPLMVCVERR